ncbi:hypothetical protein [Corynebacterium diphtheriae]|uniref:hypothetical protein n=1 Tax=Corynebacterium diphtheriae TaxID=1717 RepID=UPI0018E9559C|nr:hypothetical protein [Corynebacterium diphtheriae]
MGTQVTDMSRTFSTSLIHRDVIQQNGQDTSNQNVTLLAMRISFVLVGFFSYQRFDPQGFIPRGIVESRNLRIFFISKELYVFD